MRSLLRQTGHGEGGPAPPQQAPDAGGEPGLRAAIRRRAARHARASSEGPPSFGRYLAQAGVLGWTIVLPALAGVFAGRWMDRRLGTGIFWTGPLLMAGLGIGCWSAWRWMHRR